MTKFAFICMVATAFASVVSAAPLIPSSIAEVAAQDVDILERTGPSNGADASTFLSVDNLSNALARLKPIRTPRAPIFETIQDEPAIKTLAQQTSQEHRSVFEINGKRTRASESSTYAERGSRLRHIACVGSASIPLLEKVKQVVQEAAYADDDAVPQLMASLHELQLRTGRQSSHVFETSSSSVGNKDRSSMDTDKRAAAALKWVKSRQRKPKRFPKTSKKPLLKPSKSI